MRRLRRTLLSKRKTENVYNKEGSPRRPSRSFLSKRKTESVYNKAGMTGEGAAYNRV